MIFVAIAGLGVFLGPACVYIFLGELVRFVLPVFGDLALFYLLIFLGGFALAWGVYKAGIYE